MVNRAVLCVLTACAIGACSKQRELRGASQPSTDGRTYLAVDEADRPGCVLFVDGQHWPYALHVAAPIAPGIHEIECRDPGASARGAAVEFESRTGRTFHFDYWGP